MTNRGGKVPTIVGSSSVEVPARFYFQVWFSSWQNLGSGLGLGLGLGFWFGVLVLSSDSYPSLMTARV